MNFLEIDLDKNPRLRPKILQQPERVLFDPNDPNHCASYLTFIQEGRWTIKFEVEWPLVTVPATIERKLAMKYATDFVRGKQNPFDYAMKRSEEVGIEARDTGLVFKDGTPEQVVSLEQVRKSFDSVLGLTMRHTPIKSRAKLTVVHDAMPST